MNFIPYQFVHPFTMTLQASSFGDAVKQYAKLNHDMAINNLIVTDKIKYMKANLKYYNNGQKNKVSIALAPTVWPLNVDKDGKINTNFWPLTPEITYDTKVNPPTMYFEPSIVPINNVPLSPLSPLSTFSPLSPIPLIPSLRF